MKSKIKNKPIALHIHKHLIPKRYCNNAKKVRFKEYLNQFKERMLLAIKTRAVVADNL